MKEWKDIESGVQETLMKLPVKARINAFATMFNQDEYDGGTIPITCELCGNTVPIRESHSMYVEYRMPGRNIASYNCPAEQHFACTRVCARVLTIQCLDGHLIPIHDKLMVLRDEIEVKERLKQNAINSSEGDKESNDES